VLSGVVRHTFIIFGLFTTPNLCPLDAKSWRHHCAARCKCRCTPATPAGTRAARLPAVSSAVFLFSLPVRVVTVISLIVLSGDIQINPGPLQFGCLNCCSAAPKIPLIHDLMNDNSLDVLLISETWFTTDTPQSVLLNL